MIERTIAAATQMQTAHAKRTKIGVEGHSSRCFFQFEGHAKQERAIDL